MLIRVGGGSAGIKEYLEHGQKQGRDLERDQLDERVILDGDLELTHRIIENMDMDGEKYLHVTLSFKEDEISRETLEAITGEFKEFALAAHKSEEFNFYAEAHLPRLKEYADQKTGQAVERKPHVHIVIPKENLANHGYMNPFGLYDQNTRFLEAFQEHINHKYGLASPKDNRRVEFTGESEMISRYKGDRFQGPGAELKEKLLAEILEKGITDYNAFKALVAEHGAVRTRNEGKDSAYLNVKEPGADKGVNLKDYVFSREFVELPAEQKRAQLDKEHSPQYETAKGPRETPKRYADLLQEWREYRAKEIKYINSGNRGLYQEYKSATPERKREILDAREKRFNEKHKIGQEHERPEPARNRSPERIAADIRHIRDNLRTASRHIETASRAVEDPHRAKRNLVDRRTRSAIRKSLQRQGHQVHPREDRKPAGIEQGEAGRAGRRISNKSNVVTQIRRDHNERQAETKDKARSEFDRIKQALDGQQLLNRLSHTHGLSPEKFEVVKGPGGDRIKAGNRNLNVSDFLTKEMHLDWKDVARYLRDAYREQTGHDAGAELEKKTSPRQALWEEYQAWRDSTTESRKAARSRAWSAQKASEQVRRRQTSTDFSQRRAAIKQNRQLNPAQRRAALGVLRMERIHATSIQAKGFQQERSSLKAAQQQATRNLYRDFLLDKAGAGSPHALAELRRMKPAEITENTDLLRDETVTNQIHRDGAITFYRDGNAFLHDDGQRVHYRANDDRSIEYGLRYSHQKYGRRISVQGDPAFKARVARLAVEKGLSVEFDDPRMNRTANQARAEKTIRERQRRAIKAGKQKQQQPEAADPFAEELAYRVLSNGTVVYHRGGKDVIRDDGRIVHSLDGDQATVETALRLAQKKFGGTLNVEGGQEFKDSVARTAATLGLKLSFTDESMNETMAAHKKHMAEKAQERLPTSVEPITDQFSQYTGYVVAIDETHVYQRSGLETVRHEKRHFADLPAVGEEIQVRYQENRAQVQNLSRENERGLER